MNQRSTLTTFSALVAATLIGAVVAATFLVPATATHTPANKLAAYGSTIDVTEPGEEIELLGGSMKTSGATDLVLTLSFECSIITEVVTVGNDVSEAHAKIVAWLEIDGVPVGVTGDDSDGQVTFCDRQHRQTTTLFDDENATIDTYLATKSAHSFTWLALNLGSGEHEITAHALLTETTSDDDAFADAVIGKRTLIAEPTKLANDVTI